MTVDDRPAAALGRRARCSPTAGRASSTSRASAWTRSSARSMIYITNQDKPGFIGKFSSHARRRRHQHRDLPRRPRGAGRQRHRADRGRRRSAGRMCWRRCRRCRRCSGRGRCSSRRVRLDRLPTRGCSPRSSRTSCHDKRHRWPAAGHRLDFRCKCAAARVAVDSHDPLGWDLARPIASADWDPEAFVWLRRRRPRARAEAEARGVARQ